MLAEKTASGPFLHGPDTTQLRMLDAAISLLPAVAGAVWFFRLRAVFILLLAVGGCLGLEWLWRRLKRQPDSLRDGSALVTGLVLALLLPPNTPWWGVLLASAVAVVAAKGLFGGLGRNLLNPAAAGCAALLLLPGLRPEPLRAMSGHFLMGYTGGSLGEASSLLLLVGAAYLAVRRLLPALTALCYVCVAFLTGALIPGCDPVAVTAWGGTLLCAAFLLGDPVTTPMTLAGKGAFGALAGVACTLGAYYGFGLPGAACGVLALNLLGRGGVVLLQRTKRGELVQNG